MFLQELAHRDHGLLMCLLSKSDMLWFRCPTAIAGTVKLVEAALDPASRLVAAHHAQPRRHRAAERDLQHEPESGGRLVEARDLSQRSPWLCQWRGDTDRIIRWFEAFGRWRGEPSWLAFPESVTSIGEAAFYGTCGSLMSVVIPDSVTSIGSQAFFVVV